MQRVSARFAGVASQQVSGEIGQWRFDAWMGRQRRSEANKKYDIEIPQERRPLMRSRFLAPQA